MKACLIGLFVAALALVADQANKLWLLDVYGIEERQPIHLAPFFDVISAHNPGISYSLFSAQSPLGRWLLVAVTGVFILLIALYLLLRVRTLLPAIGFGLVMGGALGNIADRIRYGWVADFYYFHIGSFHWYVFNLADVAIVFGVALLLIEAFFLAPPEGRRGEV